ncbi:MAG: hypothetical protein GF364_18580 [Candidatus Lokiarchaeota archaeon]|nr:hypothetical protein [Candidatus Lokiarchaeota archaeon]
MQWIKKKEILGKRITEMLYDASMIKTWYRDRSEGWTLHSGIWSPIYINLRHLGSYPEIYKEVGHALGKLIKNECPKVNRIVGIATAGVPIASAISCLEDYSMGYTRKMEGVKTIEDFRKAITDYGQHTIVEGHFENNDNIILVDDLVTRLTSKLIAIEQLQTELKRRNIKAQANKILVLLDREQGALQMAQDHNLLLYSLIPFKNKGINWLKEKLSGLEFETISDYLDNSEKYQNQTIQDDLKKKAK